MNPNALRAVTFRIAILLVLIVPVAGQDTDQKWSSLSSPKADLTFEMPEGFLVDNDDRQLAVMFYKESLTLNFEVRRGPSPKERLLQLRQANEGKTANEKHSRIEIGNFIGDSYVSSETGYGIRIYLASDKGYYRIAATADSSKDPMLERFLKSIRLGDRALIKQSSSAATAAPVVPMDSLDTSDEIQKALDQPSARNPTIRYEPAASTALEPVKYWRPLIFLRTPPRGNVSVPRNYQETGSVRLKIQFKADGRIGDIIVVGPKLGRLTEYVIEAAKSIKFLPAQVDGKSVDIYHTIERFFSLN